MKTKFHLLFAIVLLVIPAVVYGQTSSRSYRGSLGEKHIEMKLNTVGNKVSGTYSYDQFLKDIQLEGSVDANGALQLMEGDGKVKTGKFSCQTAEAFGLDLECEWTRPNGTGRLMVFLHEQSVNLSSALKIVPKQIVDRKTIHVSFPQLSGALMTPAMNSFNRLVEARVRKGIKEFQPVDPADADFDANYVVLFANDRLISVELTESSYSGGAHPTEFMWTVNYNLATNKELKLEELFKADEIYKNAIADFAVKDINRRSDEIDKAEAARNKTPVTKRDEPMMQRDYLPSMSSWGLTSKGLAVYFDFPHVLAVFTKTVIPYKELANHFRPDGVAPPK